MNVETESIIVENEILSNKLGDYNKKISELEAIAKDLVKEDERVRAKQCKNCHKRVF